MPQRLQLSRAKGYRLPAGAVVVSRPTKWGNPFPVLTMSNGGRYRPGGRANEEYRRRSQVVEMFRAFLLAGDREPFTTMQRDLEELRGKDLACWCRPGQPCHADVLIKVANG